MVRIQIQISFDRLFSHFYAQNISNRCLFSFFQVATDVIKEFAADGVKYLELRSTPREEKNTGNRS